MHVAERRLDLNTGNKSPKLIFDAQPVARIRERTFKLGSNMSRKRVNLELSEIVGRERETQLDFHYSSLSYR